MRWNADGCKHCQYLGDICPDCEREAENRTEAADWERVDDDHDTRAERQYEALIYGEIR